MCRTVVLDRLDRKKLPMPLKLDFTLYCASRAKTTELLDALGRPLIALSQGEVDLQHVHQRHADQAAERGVAIVP